MIGLSVFIGVHPWPKNVFWTFSAASSAGNRRCTRPLARLPDDGIPTLNGIDWSVVSSIKPPRPRVRKTAVAVNGASVAELALFGHDIRRNSC
jgi:hypothetical protein